MKLTASGERRIWKLRREGGLLLHFIRQIEANPTIRRIDRPAAIQIGMRDVRARYTEAARAVLIDRLTQWSAGARGAR